MRLLLTCVWSADDFCCSQGWASHRGASNTFYDAGVVGSPSGQPGINDDERPAAASGIASIESDGPSVEAVRNQRHRFATNLEADYNWQNYTYKFDADHPLCQTLIRQPGRGVAVYKVSQYGGWQNYCQTCAIRIVYIRSYVKPSAQQIDELQRIKEERQRAQQEEQRLEQQQQQQQQAAVNQTQPVPFLLGPNGQPVRIIRRGGGAR